ncbi:hypothetical protein ACMFMG_006451 [Clarireedia jacksonii]
MAPIPTLLAPPGKSTPYTIPAFSGELITIPTSNSTMRLLVTGAETSNAFAVVGTGGTQDDPIGFHFHREAHDVFLCLKGSINVWANDKARSLGPGDFASVPPGTIHQYQVTGAHSEFLGLILPGTWIEFFRFIGEPYLGPLFPTTDRRNPLEVLVPKLIAATEKFDMVPVRDKAQFPPQAWEASDETLPGVCENGGYFLREGTGEKRTVGGWVVRALARRQETNGRFSIWDVQGSEMREGLGSEKMLGFAETHHAIFVVEGTVEVVVGEEKVRVTAGETSFVPAGCRWRVGFGSRWGRVYVFANGGGIGEVMMELGEKYEHVGIPDAVEENGVDKARLEGLKETIKDLIF